jgi:hypothetical protein
MIAAMYKCLLNKKNPGKPKGGETKNNNSKMKRD